MTIGGGAKLNANGRELLIAYFLPKCPTVRRARIDDETSLLYVGTDQRYLSFMQGLPKGSAFSLQVFSSVWGRSCLSPAVQVKAGQWFYSQVGVRFIQFRRALYYGTLHDQPDSTQAQVWRLISIRIFQIPITVRLPANIVRSLTRGQLFGGLRSTTARRY